MKKSIFLLIITSLLLSMTVPVFSADKETDKAGDIKFEIVKQEQISREGADTFWTGVVIGGSSAAVLIPVSTLFKDKQGKEMKVIYIVGAGMAIPTIICMIWGGTQWLLAEGGLNNLKRKQNDLTITPYLNPLAQSSTGLGLEVNIKL